MASNLHTFELRCEGLRVDGRPCRDVIGTFGRLDGDLKRICKKCGHINDIKFSVVQGIQFVNGERAERAAMKM